MVLNRFGRITFLGFDQVGDWPNVWTTEIRTDRNGFGFDLVGPGQIKPNSKQLALPGLTQEGPQTPCVCNTLYIAPHALHGDVDFQEAHADTSVKKAQFHKTEGVPHTPSVMKHRTLHIYATRRRSVHQGPGPAVAGGVAGICPPWPSMGI